MCPCTNIDLLWAVDCRAFARSRVQSEYLESRMNLIDLWQMNSFALILIFAPERIHSEELHLPTALSEFPSSNMTFHYFGGGRWHARSRCLSLWTTIGCHLFATIWRASTMCTASLTLKVPRMICSSSSAAKKIRVPQSHLPSSWKSRSYSGGSQPSRCRN